MERHKFRVHPISFWQCHNLLISTREYFTYCPITRCIIIIQCISANHIDLYGRVLPPSSFVLFYPQYPVPKEFPFFSFLKYKIFAHLIHKMYMYHVCCCGIFLHFCPADIPASDIGIVAKTFMLLFS